MFAHGGMKALLLALMMTLTSQQQILYSRGGRTQYEPRYQNIYDDLQRGQEGLLVQLDNVNKALKEDELKLNNVFYKLGRHDTDIQATTNDQIALRKTAQKLEAKLNKQSFNVDFLRRHVAELKQGFSQSSAAIATVDALQKTVKELQITLAQTIYRTSQLENTTKTLERRKQSTSSDDNVEDNNIYYTSRSPKTTYYYLEGDVLSGVCDELQGWTVTLSGGCWWIGHDLSNYTEALVKCASKGAFLAQLPSNNDKWPEQLKKLFTTGSLSQNYWTSATTAYNDEWSYMFSGDPVADRHWADAVLASSRTGNRNCAALTPPGLVAFACSMRNAYICEKF